MLDADAAGRRRSAFRRGYPLLGALAALALLGYAATYLVNMPEIRSASFVPASVDPAAPWPSFRATVQAGCILLYALALLPVVVLFSVRRGAESPYAFVGAATLLCLSLVVEILNNLPLLTAGAYAPRLAAIPDDVLLYLRQVEAVRFIAFDVPGFAMAYAGFAVYAAVFGRSRRLFSTAVWASIGLFVASVPFLWLEPRLAIVLMCASIVVLAPVPMLLARIAVEEPAQETAVSLASGAP